MKVSGSATLHAPVSQVWEALNDPAVLARTIPGCEQLEEVAENRYRMTVTAGVASIRGSFGGDVALVDQKFPESFVLKARGAGGPGTVSAEVLVRLAEGAGETTLVTYDADAVVGGTIGGVGQRMLTGVARKTAGEFFGAIDDHLAGRLPSGAPAVGSGDAAGSDAEGPVTARVFRSGGSSATGVLDGATPVAGIVIGAAIALASVLVASWALRRRP